MNPNPELVAQNKQFEKQVIELAAGVYGAIGFAASNVYMLVGDDGLVVIDTTETTKAAENILGEFRKITDKPVKTIIYTHSHRDHISGATVFAEGASPEVIASDNFESDLVDVDTRHPHAGQALMARTKRQFGMSLSFPDERVSVGVGPGDRPMQGMGAGFLEPTLSITEARTQLNRCGMALELVKAPGETPDHIVVWFAQHRLLFSGDNFYSSFPNLYAIRGTAYRDFNAWADTLELLLGFDADTLAPGHTMPVVGAMKVKEVLTDYRDAISHVVAETVAGMNKQLGPDELAHTVRLPSELAQKPYLKEFYGKVSWSVRAYFAGTLGWFDGNPTNLARMSPQQSALRMMTLAGGEDKLLDAAKQSFADQDYQWVLELSDHLIAAGKQVAEAKRLKVLSLRSLADQEINAAGRNYYLLSAYEIEQETS
ncbi:MAG: alkyl/aryl-sulfatase [Gammaproteobacteria bacterium]|nr:alkyl/aryl-sulfatase [Gammaproteobacteria bacterium]